MTSKKTTRRALFSSIMALLLCCSMLIGTTFAWFTDSVTSAGNIIKSGTLDVKMYYGDSADETSMTNVEDDPADNAIFYYDLWEPGFTQTKYIKIANNGDLAFQYQLHMIPNDSIAEGTKLAEVIDVYCDIVETGDGQNGNFKAPTSSSDMGSLTKLGTLEDLMASATGVDDGILLPTYGSGTTVIPETVDPTTENYTGFVTVCMALHMQEDAGNDYQNLSIGDGFDVQLVATQMTYEKDSFDHQYDENAEYPDVLSSAEAAYEASLTAGNFRLGGNYKTSETDKAYSANRQYAIKDGKAFTLNLNGHTIEHDTVYGGMTYLFTVAYNGTLTLDGDGTIVSTNGADHANEENCIVYAQSTGTAIINGGNYYPENGIAVWAGSGAHIIINGGNFVSTGEKQCELIYSSGGVIDIYDGFFHNTAWENRPVNVANGNRGTGFINIYGGTFVNFDPSTGGDDPSNILVADGYKVVSETQANGDIWYTVVAE